MTNWQLPQNNMYESAGANTADSGGVELVSGAANTKGSWTEIISATTMDWEQFIVLQEGNPIIGESGLLDIAVGAAASEVAVISNLYMGLVKVPGHMFSVPIAVKSGSRVSARFQAEGSGKKTDIFLMGLHGGAVPFLNSYFAADSMGENTSNSQGTQVDAGAVANTKGAWAQIVASTSNPYSALSIGLGTASNSALVNGDYLLDIGIGGAGSEVVLTENLYFHSNSSTDTVGFEQCLIPCQIPSAARIAARLQSTVTDVTDRIMDLVLHGFYG